MAWASPEYSRNQVDRAGRLLATLATLESNEPVSAEAVDEAYEVLNNWRAAHSLRMTSNVGRGGHYFLMRLEVATGSLAVWSYAKRDLGRATKDYLRVERTYSGTGGVEVVLVSADSLQSLRRAYPNYFLDTRVFVEEIGRLIAE